MLACARDWSISVIGIYLRIQMKFIVLIYIFTDGLRAPMKWQNNGKRNWNDRKMMILWASARASNVIDLIMIDEISLMSVRRAYVYTHVLRWLEIAVRKLNLNSSQQRLVGLLAQFYRVRTGHFVPYPYRVIIPIADDYYVFFLLWCRIVL